MFDQIADVVPAIHKKGVELRGRGVALDGLSRSSEIISCLTGLPHSPFLTVKWLRRHLPLLVIKHKGITKNDIQTLQQVPTSCD